MIVNMLAGFCYFISCKFVSFNKIFKLIYEMRRHQFIKNLNFEKVLIG